MSPASNKKRKLIDELIGEFRVSGNQDDAPSTTWRRGAWE